ncbi:capsular polysaccharide biosynthesis protein [Marivita hallyeonensis]|uniref:Capsular polysaccharide export protein n=1 Tax=Marivita hallyeonensis TaxID=996342 RepID=A0A1M5MSS7_9RHOB|nr:capsular polysaccharide biosynthesis protein [Marivita hallyeonensis]SHG80296.1 capsular polysaccharide export protein [Marivita hallyeonensis]
MSPSEIPSAEGASPRRLCVYNSGFLTQSRIKRILSLAGWQVSLGQPKDGDWVGVWGDAPSAQRGVAVAEGRNAPVLRVEDAFLRSLHPGRVAHEPPLGLLLDTTGMHFDASRPSDLETLLIEDPLDDTALLNDARMLMARMMRERLSKYSACERDILAPDPGYVLVIDQAENDASVRASVPDAKVAKARFAEMLYYAQTEHPAARILIRSHPETRAGKRGGHYTEDQAQGRISFVDGNIAPADLFSGATAVYTLSSQMGFEAILAGHKPRVFGTPFYAGWGLSEDEHSLDRRQRKLTRAQLFAAAMIKFPVWYDPFEDCLCDLARVMDVIEARRRAWQDDHQGWVGQNIRLWKRPHMNAMFGQHKQMRFGKSASGTARTMVWGSGPATVSDAWRVEDGFIRSQGLGAELVPPLSLALDDLGMYYDPTRPSRLETLISESADLPDDAVARTRRLMARIVSEGVTKYHSGTVSPSDEALGETHRILVPGQVEDDASILLGSPDITSNSALLECVRAKNPEAHILYKPHPDVLAGLRPGAVPQALDWADEVTTDAPIACLFGKVDALWTLTSLAGFEALMRGLPVTTLGVPFYAGWGLTTDLCEMPDRRTVKVPLEGLVHAALIAYPRYFDPVTGQTCPVEVVLDRLATGAIQTPPRLRALSKAQGLLSTYSWLWRR